MSRTALSTATAGSGSLGPKSVVSRSGVPKCLVAKAHGGDELGCHTAQKATVQPKSLPASRLQSKRLPTADSGQPVSRVELLLAPRSPRPVYKPEEDTAVSAALNKKIKLAQHWGDVRTAIEGADLSASNIAFAIYRLGCIFTFSSRFRQTELLKSGLIDDLLHGVQHKLYQLDVGAVTLLLDGCARLEARPAEHLLVAVAHLIYGFASSFEATQLPLVFWAFKRLNFRPRSNVLSALEIAAERLAPTMSPQGLALTLHGFQAQLHHPSRRTLARFADAMHRQLAQFKVSEIAMAVEAFAAFRDFKLPTHLIVAIAQRSGQSVHSNIVSGKPSLSRQSSGELTLMGRAVSESELQQRASSPLAATAGRLIRHVSAQIGELDSALVAPALLTAQGAAIVSNTLKST